MGKTTLGSLAQHDESPIKQVKTEGLTTAARKDGRALQDIQRLVDDAGLTVRTVSKHELNMLSGNRSMPRTLADAAARGWAVIGAAAERGAMPVSQFKVDRPTVLVMGNEGYGLRATVKRCCTQLVQIEMSPPPAVPGSSSSSSQHLVDSLNVSVATGILLHQLITAASMPAVMAQ
eukprot:gene13568-13694_t